MSVEVLQSDCEAISDQIADLREIVDKTFGSSESVSGSDCYLMVFELSGFHSIESQTWHRSWARQCPCETVLDGSSVLCRKLLTSGMHSPKVFKRNLSFFLSLYLFDQIIHSDWTHFITTGYLWSHTKLKTLRPPTIIRASAHLQYVPCSQYCVLHTYHHHTHKAFHIPLLRNEQK